MAVSGASVLAQELKQHHRRNLLILQGLLLFTLVSVLFTMSQGPVRVPYADLPRLLFGRDLQGQDQIYQSFLLHIRFPRVLLAAFAGAVLAVAGASLQALFRNPLAEPGLIGVSAGASMGAVLAIVLLGGGLWVIAPMAFAGSMGATILAYLIGRRYGGVAGLLLAGIAINAIVFSIIGLMTYMASDTELRDFTFWSMGSVATASWRVLAGLVPWCMLWLIFLVPQWRALNVLLLGHKEVQHLGFDMKRLRWRIVVLVSLLIAPIVALTGGIAFVGLIVPHMVRMMMGSNHRYVMPACIFGGAILLVWADFLARVLIAPAELPVGLLTSMIGGPFFLWLLLRAKRQ